MSRKKKTVTVRTKYPDFHKLVETQPIISTKRLAAQLDEIGIDPAAWVTDETIAVEAGTLARTLYGSYEDVDRAYTDALSEVHRQLGDGMFNRLEGAGEAVKRRELMAAYFIGVRCGRMTAGGAR